MNYYIDAIKNYVNFKGRATRKQFWMFILMNFIISYLIVYVGSLLGQIGIFFAILYPFVMLIPIISLTARRLHDSNKSSWFLLCYMIPFGGILLLILLLLKSFEGENKYGPALK